MAEIPAIAERRRALARRHPVWRPQTLDRMLRRQAESFGGRPMVITDEGTWSYAEVVEMAERLARGLHAGGVGPGDRVAMVMANHAIFIPLALAVWRLGASLIPVNFAFQARELGYVIGQSACRTVVTMAAFRDLDYLAMLDELAPGWEGGAHDRFPELRQVITFGGGRTGVPTVDDILARGAAETAPLYDNPATPDDPAVIMYTSGTTGAPKGVLQSHDSLLRNGYATAMQRAFEDGRRMLFSLPLYHAFALVSGTISCFWAGGAIIPRLVFDPLDTLQACERHRATDILFVPTMAMAVVEHPDIGNYDLSSLFACQSAAAATPVRVWQQLAEGLGLPELVTGYGMTELSAATTMTEPDDPLLRLEQTVGRVMRGGAAGMPELGGLVAEYRTADPYSGEFLPDGAEGELVCRSPFATTGYFAKPAETEALFLPGGWLRSG
ncbi:MAG: AMP-binding protein, partial [Alphaproteobacteria bacterium]|nr:AMP-binding protein [Alphaproteobacteria bacterium]